MTNQSPKPSPTLSSIKEAIGITNDIASDFAIHALAPLEHGSANDVSYIDQAKYFASLAESKVGAVLVREADYEAHKALFPSHIQPLFVANPHLAFALLSHHFALDEFATPHAKSAESSPAIHESVTIMQGAYIGADVSIGANTTIMPGVVISDGVRIGEDCTIFPNVVIYRQSVIENRVRIHAGSVIGSDGFGYAHTNDGRHIKIEHNGIVHIQDDVEIGANVTIDRAVFGETLIKKGAKIDNLVQIGHNCVIGEHSLLVSQVGLAGSTTTGRNVVFGGQAGTGGHIHIGDFTQIAGRGAVGKNLPPNTKWGGHPLMPLDEWMKFYVSLRRMLKKEGK
ncbi:MULTISPECIES: UDP-3-O-(3-hydroxymyristoyl)glucosamine N-acyltransferase [unclassified Helicobacter]|uniref:UDP-3-O-(3-hydroxymyristoyl)glucosamine N-acyltransferase n=1 Tax=unclassified Helicobacter TaxID=2593540 RepID=UPI0009EF0E38|nr:MULTISPECIES: UDP-3-O-(3-hydroxymyristoyl)glucosamine N-acyltransferase [unclassified Helicobacter]